jgi:dCMP deaminase
MKHLEKYKKIAKLLASFSYDSRVKVGALILKDGRIVATGYNGQLSGDPHEPILGKDDHDISTVHAEQNCLCFCAKQGIATNGCEMVVTHSPCVHCIKMLIQAGIIKIYCLEMYKPEENPYLSKIEVVKI